jgi:hypothetical protein
LIFPAVKTIKRGLVAGKIEIFGGYKAISPAFLWPYL